MNIYENLKKNLKVLRSSLNLTQQKLADELQIPRVNLARYETGENVPPLDIIIRIADYFEISLDELLDRKAY